MWKAMGRNISMAEGDYGERFVLPARCIGADLTADDTVRFTFKNQMNGSAILEKDFTPLDNVVMLFFTAEESALFPVGQYVYSVDWYKDGEFMCNIVPCGTFKVVDKA